MGIKKTFTTITFEVTTQQRILEINPVREYGNLAFYEVIRFRIEDNTYFRTRSGFAITTAICNWEIDPIEDYGNLANYEVATVMFKFTIQTRI